MGTIPAILKKVREICLSFPGTKETMTWGKPHFRVGEKIFAGFDEEAGKPTIGFKLEMEHAAEAIKYPRFTRAPFVGHKGWVSMDATGITDWEKVRALIFESYRLIAPKRSLAKYMAASPTALSSSDPRSTNRGGQGTRRRAGR
jgi:predicted DNA-binding protein (MmcQ/YjbR family)